MSCETTQFVDRQAGFATRYVIRSRMGPSRGRDRGHERGPEPDVVVHPCTYVHNSAWRPENLLAVSLAGLRKTINDTRPRDRLQEAEARTAITLLRKVLFSFLTDVTTFWPGFRPLSKKIRSEGD